MLFNSVSFFLFFPLTTVIYFVLPHRLRPAHLLLCSCFFYAAWIPAYLLILLGIIIFDYVAGLLIAPASGRLRRFLLIASLLANVSLLAVFKYFDFASENFSRLASFIHWNYPVRHLGMLLPIGLSFHTFQSMAYTIEVYKGRQAPERNLGIYALYVMFYPQLVAGPIERPQHLLHQFRRKHRFEADRVFEGLQQMLWGLFKKIVVADRLATIVDAIYLHPEKTGGFWLILATWMFAVQIYCDFSGYSDMAIGAARVLGFNLIRNFDRPYAAESVAEFWRRWHISLSTWFRDYLYIPLGGSRVSLPRWCFNILVVFLVSGLWHGANWTFAVWGALHGVFLILSRLTAGVRQRLAEAIPASPLNALAPAWRTIITFNIVAFAWIFFRSPTIADALTVCRQIVSPHFFSPPQLDKAQGGFAAYTAAEFNIGIVIAIVLFVVEWLRDRQIALEMNRHPTWSHWLGYYAMIVSVIWLGVFGGRTFIYFQF